MNQFIDYSENQMLAMWKRQMHIDVVRRECTVERDDGIDLDDMLLVRLRHWYAHLLLTAPLEWVPVEDLRAEVIVTATADGIVTAQLPERCVRPVEWQLAGWQHSVTMFVDPASTLARAQHSHWLRGGIAQPVIVKYDDRLVLYGIIPGASPVLMQARCVAIPEDGRYICHQDALATLPKWDESLG